MSSSKDSGKESGHARLDRLLSAVPDAPPMAGAEAIEVSGITADSREVTPGDLFVAVPGTKEDGHEHVVEAIERGAVAVVAEREVEGAALPIVLVENARRALAELAAEWNGRPADRLSLVGITGSFGKTSVLSMLEAVLITAGQRIGVVGSDPIGFRYRGEPQHGTPFTTPDPLLLQQGLADLQKLGADLVAMEVTSHALAQDRVHGLGFVLGIFTNLAPLEHKEYHGTFENYVSTKRRFLDHLNPRAPLVYRGDDPVLRPLVSEGPFTSIACGIGADSDVRLHPREVDMRGSRVEIVVRNAFPRVDGGSVEPMCFELDLPLLGRSHLLNATLAVIAALALGADVTSAQEALSSFPTTRRRMQIVHRGGFTVLDDTATHPDSLSVLFEVLERFSYRRLHIAFAVRGQRGTDLNRQAAATLGVWSERVPIATLVATSSSEVVDENNRPDLAEVQAFVEGLDGSGLACEAHERLDDAVTRVLDGAGDGDLVVLLGAQGMDEGAGVVERWLRRLREHPRPPQLA